MSKTKIEFDYDGTHYELEYTAKTLKQLERSGFSFGNIDDHIIGCTEDLFYGAFLANHKNVSRKVKEKIFAEMSECEEDGDDKLAEVLFQMVQEALESLTPSGNLKWKKTN